MEGISDISSFPSFILSRQNGGERKFSLRVHGDHNILNALAAIALADLLGLNSSKKALVRV